MPELRKDWLTGRSVIVAENRALRPNEFTARTAKEPVIAFDSTNCPFCPGNESRTPPAVYEQTDEQGRWQLRVVPNKFPALSLERENFQAGAEPAFGVHEVIVESRRHVDRTPALSTQELCRVLESYAERLRHWRDFGELAYGLVFKNQGPRAGASIAHLHSQLIALPAIPPVVDAELNRASEEFTQQNVCPYCRLIEQEQSLGARIVLDRDGYVAFCPFASVQTHEVWLMPASHAPSFEQPANLDALERLAGVLHALISRLESIVPDLSYNMLLRTAPWRIGGGQWFHWRIELLPRANSIAGLELATGIFINPVAPEHAAQQLRPV